MSEFKVGDRVKAKASYDRFDGGRPGAGTVVRIDALDDTLLIRFDDWSGGHAGGECDGSEDKWWISDDDLEPAAETAESFVVFYISASREYHATLADAEEK